MNEKTDMERKNDAQSLLPFNPADLMTIRVLPAEFSRMIGTTKQTVSRWIREGKLSIGTDGRLNPSAAMRQLARTCDPGRFRVRLIKQAVSDMRETMEQAARANELEQQLADAQREISRLSEIVRMMKEAHRASREYTSPLM